MRQKRHREYPAKDDIEVFKNLPKSKFWPYLSRNTRIGILALLDESQDKNDGDQGELRTREC